MSEILIKSEPTADDDNLFTRGHTHHASQGRWLTDTVVKHPGHPDQRVHGRRGKSDISDPRHFPGSHVEPVAAAAAGRESYIAEHGGITGPVDYAEVHTTPERQAAIASAYDGLPMDDPAAHAAYRQLRDEVNQQYDYMTGELGVKVEVVDHDPYPDAAALAADLRDNNRIKVLATSTTGSHPFFTDDENDKFRAVHDYFGHAATGRGFDRHGEEAAWVSHSRMFSPEARKAMTTETRGQNASLITNGDFPPQKVAILPSEFIAYTGGGVNKSVVVLMPVVKHPGNHDQKVHGRRYANTVSPAVVGKTLELVRENGGLSIKMTDGSEPPDGYMVSRNSDKFGRVVSAEEFFDPERGHEILSEHLIANRSELGSGRAYLGVWHQTQEQAPDGTMRDLPFSEQRVHLDITDRIVDRDQAVRLGRRRNQISVWDVANFEEIQTGGSGGTVAKYQATSGVGHTEAAHGDDRRRDPRVGERAVDSAHRSLVIVLPVVKHPGHPDQKVHGRRGDAGANGNVAEARETGEPMGLGWPCPPDIQEQFDRTRAGEPDAADLLLQDANDQAAYAGLDQNDSNDGLGDTPETELYAEAVFMRAEGLRQQDVAFARATPEEIAATQSMVNDVRENGVVCIAADPDSAMAILTDGQFRSQFDTGTSGGYLGADARARSETMMFDTHPSVNSEHRVIYGYVASDGGQVGSGGPAQYGEVRFVMRDSVRDRTTMTVGDSMSGHSFPVHMNGPAVGERDAWNSVSRNGWAVHGMTAHQDPIGYQQRGYFEAQIHSGVRVSDVAQIHLMGSRDDWYDTVNEIIDAAAVHGIPVVFDE